MSKTNFVDGDPSRGILGTVVTADFLNALNKHYHTGLDQDGHGALLYAADTGTVNAYIVNLSPALTQYISGMPIYFMAANANTGASTINVNSLGVKTIKKNGSINLVNGDIQVGQIIEVSYDGTNFQFIGTPRNAAYLWDGTAGRSASPTPTANTIPVSGSNNTIAVGFENARSCFVAYRNGSQTIGSAATKVQINAVRFDTDSIVDITTNYRVTPTVPGKYAFWGMVGMSGTTATGLQTAIYLNGSVYQYGPWISSGAIPAGWNFLSMNTLWAPVYLTVIDLNGTTDYIELWGYATGTGTLSFVSGNTTTYLTGCRVGR